MRRMGKFKIIEIQSEIVEFCPAVNKNIEGRQV